MADPDTGVNGVNNERAPFLDSEGRPKTQALFYEIRYDPEALYSLKEYDLIVDGKTYPSAKRLFLEIGDPTEYEFATKYFLGWKHWKRICENKQLSEHINQWREELEMKLRSEAVRQTMTMARNGSYQAAKFMVDRGYAKRQAGRPTAADIEREVKFQAAIQDEYSADVIRLAK